MYEITINMSWFPAWMMWTLGGAMYFSIGVILSCLFKAREARQEYYVDHGCGKECCPGVRCGQTVQISYSERHSHRCRGDNLTIDHKFSWEASQIAKCASLVVWPLVLVIGAGGQIACVIKDLWHHAEQYGLKGLKKPSSQG